MGGWTEYIITDSYPSSYNAWPTARADIFYFVLFCFFPIIIYFRHDADADAGGRGHRGRGVNPEADVASHQVGALLLSDISLNILNSVPGNAGLVHDKGDLNSF